MAQRARAFLAESRTCRATGTAAGAVEALLLARLVLILFAARPSNPMVQTILAVTSPLVWPLAALDRGQPLFGASLEFSTLVMVVVIPALAAVVGRRRWRGGGVQARYH